MIPVQDNWLHIDNVFIDSCEQIINHTRSDNLQHFKKLGLFKLLLPESLGGRNGHLQDLLECQVAMSEHCVTTADMFTRIASAPYLIQQFGDTVFQEVFGADNNALVYLYPGDMEHALFDNIDPVYDWIVVQNGDKLCLLDVNNINFLPEHRIISLRTLADVTHCLSWYQVYNRVLTTSALGGARHVIRKAMINGDTALYTVLGQVASEVDEMLLVLHRNINHALLHTQNGEVIPMYDRVKYKVQSANAWFKTVNYLKKVDLIANNKEISSIISGISAMNIEHLSDVNCEFLGYIEYLKQENTEDMYL